MFRCTHNRPTKSFICQLVSHKRFHHLGGKWKKIPVLGLLWEPFTGDIALVSPHFYRALVRLPLEYGAQFWSPTKRVDVERFEKVQARATKLVPAIRHNGYQRRLPDLGLFKFEQRRLRGLLIETFKILRGISGLDPASVFELSVNRTRNQGYKLVPPRFNTVSIGISQRLGCALCNLWKFMSFPSRKMVVFRLAHPMSTRLSRFPCKNSR